MRHKHKNYACGSGCAVEATLEVIGGKWKGVIITHLLTGPKHFNELNRTIENITQRMLSRQLRELVEFGLIERTVQPTTPPMVEYRVSKLGETLVPVINSLRDWGENHTTASNKEN